MRKVIAVAVAALMVGAAFAPAASAGKKKKVKPQVVEGSIMVPQGGQGAATCVYRIHRTLFIGLGAQANGVFGHTFEVDPKTVGRPFTLDASDGTGMDISFYADLGASDPSTAPANMAYETPGPGGEKGTVPPGLPYGFVCMTDGTNGTFKYATK